MDREEDTEGEQILMKYWSTENSQLPRRRKYHRQRDVDGVLYRSIPCRPSIWGIKAYPHLRSKTYPPYSPARRSTQYRIIRYPINIDDREWKSFDRIFDDVSLHTLNRCRSFCLSILPYTHTVHVQGPRPK
jgi:hypothetical protein